MGVTDHSESKSKNIPKKQWTRLSTKYAPVLLEIPSFSTFLISLAHLIVIDKCWWIDLILIHWKDILSMLVLSIRFIDGIIPKYWAAFTEVGLLFV